MSHPNPFANPKSSKRDALNHLANEPGWQLFEERLQDELSKTIEALSRASGLQEVGLYQGRLTAYRRVIELRNEMIMELEMELERENVLSSAKEKAMGAFWSTRQNTGGDTT